MRQQRLNFRLITFFLILLILSLAAYESYSLFMNGSRWMASSVNPRVKSESKNVIRGDIYDRNNVLLASTNDGQRVFQSKEKARKAVVHVLGDEERNIANGIEGFHAGYLLGFNTTLAERVVQLISQKEVRKGDDLVLTIDSSLSTYILDQFTQRAGNKNGAVVVTNYKTGEILAMVSFPNFDPKDISEKMKKDLDQPFWNRASQGLYPPGSTFKIITLAAAFQYLPDAATRTMVCSGHLQVGDSAVTDAGGRAHGEVTLKEAFEVSCNNVFAQLALEIGDQKLRKTAENFGFNDNFLFGDLVVENSSYPIKNRTEKELAWSGVGQSAIISTPLHMAMVAGAIANNGNMMEPKLLKKVTSNNQSETAMTRKTLTPVIYKKALNQGAAQTIKGYMQSVVDKGSGTGAKISGLTLGGKTGSAETSLQGENVTHAWFVGFIDSLDQPYAISVVVEKGDSGSRVAAPIARAILNHLKKNN